MRLDTVDDQSTPSDERTIQVRNTEQGLEQGLMTPALRAALDALEREFHELLRPAASR